MVSIFRHWRRLRLRRLAERVPIEISVWRAAIAGRAVFERLSGEDSERLRRLATQFLRDKIFEPAMGMVLDEIKCARIAGLAALPILGLDYEWYDGWRTVIVHPGEFVRPRASLDDSGVLHQWEDVLSGESWDRGPVVLSWDDVEASGHGDGYNVVVHEMAHKLDMLNGPPDGFPPLHEGMSRHAWTERFSDAFEDLKIRLDRGEPTGIDPYAAEQPGEFFAVASEYFFESPAVLRAEYPGVYGLLTEFYRQDPAVRLWGRWPQIAGHD